MDINFYESVLYGYAKCDSFLEEMKLIFYHENLIKKKALKYNGEKMNYDESIKFIRELINNDDINNPIDKRRLFDSLSFIDQVEKNKLYLYKWGELMRENLIKNNIIKYTSNKSSYFVLYNETKSKGYEGQRKALNHIINMNIINNDILNFALEYYDLSINDLLSKK